ncbi:MAG: HAMP domain-containing histidine kinase, partial [Muribaculaceae bacterium]|nr:HAMP domain-containing histidine kinase [Muribaculaceae bacterium]
IKGYLDTIIENPDMEASSREHFQLKAREHINRLVNLITDVSAITRLEEGAGMISTEEMDYHDVVYNIASDVEESGAAGNLEFSYDVPLDCMVVGNYNLLSGMLINLVKNASSYSKGTECGVKLLREDEKFYYFSFYDNGIGVGEEHIPHLFERFYRVDSGRSRKAGGTGLGLPIVQSTILAHGGSIEIHNREGGGLEFIYSLPKTRPE